MKKTILSIPLVLLLLAGCRKTDNPTVFDLGVDMQTTFEKDHVQVLIDNQPLLNTELTTNRVLGLAKSVSTAGTEGTHSIKNYCKRQYRQNRKFYTVGRSVYWHQL